ncbi:hypothetical protein H5V45_05060 [Nocardioides sp. KIGAM211]|uniref:Lipoprotein n=1 Tax=Nocardioides luti TaxID=2761101 RepID=A0A7X0RE80_9ACTN|nr:hypothetical protein [Nocardioides luti]MBB6626688.1 hypothetical protein [Nocardioides luti]
MTIFSTRSRRRWTVVVPLVAAAAVALAGCGEEGPGDGPDPAAHTLPEKADRVPITDRAVAAIALAHLSDDTSSREGTYTDGSDPKGIRWTDLRYRASPGEDGDLVRVAVWPGREEYVHCQKQDEGCEVLDTDVPGGRIYLHWSEVTEEDPGSLYAVLERAGESSYILQSGAKITGDPREMEDLAVTVDDMVAVLEDPWLRVRTSPDAVAAGEDVSDWTPRPSYSK